MEIQVIQFSSSKEHKRNEKETKKKEKMRKQIENNSRGALTARTVHRDAYTYEIEPVNDERSCQKVNKKLFIAECVVDKTLYIISCQCLLSTLPLKPASIVTQLLSELWMQWTKTEKKTKTEKSARN